MKRLLLLAVLLLCSTAFAANARAVAQYDAIVSTDASANMTVRFHADIADVNNNIGSAQKIDVVFAPTDTSAQMLVKITTAVVNAASAAGFTVARTDVLVASFSRGQ